MTLYYCRAGFSDSNNGLTPATAVGTIGKLIGASGLMASGDQAYIGGGIYRFSAAQAITLAPSAETKITGDPTGEKTGDPGEVIITGFGTNDSTTPYTGTLFSIAAARNFYTWENLTFQAPVGVMFPLAANGCHDWKFTDCVFYSRQAGSDLFQYTSVAGAAATFTWTRCYFFCFGAANSLTITSTLHTSDYNLTINFNTCYFKYKSGKTILMTTTAGSGSGIPYGVNADSCHFDGATSAFTINAGTHSAAGGASISTWKHNFFDVGATAAIVATNTNQVASSYNRSPTTNANTNVTAGTGDDFTAAKSWRPDLGQMIKFGFQPRHFLTPTKGDPHLTFVASTETPPTADLINRPVPAGGASLNYQVGCLGRHDTAVVGTSISGDSGGWSEIVGPGDQEYLVWCAAQATTITVKVKWDATYGNTLKPQMQIVANGAIGVALDTQTASGTAGSAYETLTSTFTPTAAGLVRVRIISRSGGAAGVLAYDTFTVA